MVLALLIVGFLETSWAGWDTWNPAGFELASPSQTGVGSTEPSIAVHNQDVLLVYIGKQGLACEVMFARRTSVGTWEPPVQVSAVGGNCNTPPNTRATEPAIALWQDSQRTVYAVWTQYGAGAPFGSVYFAKSLNYGTTWSITQLTNPTAAADNPHVTTDQDFVYVSWSQQDGSWGRRVWMYRESRVLGSPAPCFFKVTADAGFHDDIRPDIVVDRLGPTDHVTNIVYQRQSNYPSIGPWGIWAVRNPNPTCTGAVGDPWPLPSQIDSPSILQSDSVDPSLAHSSTSTMRYLHVAWEEDRPGLPLLPPRIMYHRSDDLGASWDPADIRVASATTPTLSQTEPSIAACTACVVGITWTAIVSGDTHVFFQWSEDVGETWPNAPVDLITAVSATDIDRASSLAMDERRGTTDTLYPRFHTAWDGSSTAVPPVSYVKYRYSGGGETGTTVAILNTGLPPRGATAAVFDDAADRAYLFGGQTGFDSSDHLQLSDAIYRYDSPASLSLRPPPQVLLPDSGKAYMPAVWWPEDLVRFPTESSRAYLFWGTKGPWMGSTSSCITVYVPAEASVSCSPGGGAQKRIGAAAVFDGQYIWVFGGGIGYGSRDILMIDTFYSGFQPDNPGVYMVNLCPAVVCLPDNSLYSAAAWDSVNNLIWIVRGVPDPHYNPTVQNRAIYRFDPTYLTISQVTQLPQTVDGVPAPATRFSAVYDRAIQRVLIFGGSVTCIDNGVPAPGCPAPYTWDHDTIFRFNPTTSVVTLDPCLRLPSARRDTSAVWRDSDDNALVFGGAVGVFYYGGTWTGVGEVVHYVG